ncbi:MAG: hypothetical protein CIT01_00645 [Methanobacterium sp. BRmetb2]|nr:MAG: hypothetical protein CIT01_00645 [Methanobacterium sp. BRmetb2]
MGFSREVKENLLVACHRRCCICHKSTGIKIEVHHIIPTSKGGPDTEENGIPLCFDCHAEVCAYNPNHPKGNKFSHSELRRHKEQWFKICQNGLYPLNKPSQKPGKISHVGIRSFERGAGYMPNETEKMLCLTDFFNEKQIKDDNNWNGEIFNKLKEFTKELSPKFEYRLHLETHLSIAFVIGYLLDSKSGIEIYPMQKSRGKKDWSPEGDYTKKYTKLEKNIEILSNDPKDVVLVIGITHNILEEVKKYINTNQIQASKIIKCNVEGYVGNNAIIDGTHAIELVNSLSTILNERRDTHEKRNTLHIFAACPVGFIFYLGQISRIFGKIKLYEYDSEDFVYSPSFKLPTHDNVTKN